jgi:hypothetical protein
MYLVKDLDQTIRFCLSTFIYILEQNFLTTNLLKKKKITHFFG